VQRGEPNNRRLTLRDSSARDDRAQGRAANGGRMTPRDSSGGNGHAQCCDPRGARSGDGRARQSCRHDGHRAADAERDGADGRSGAPAQRGSRPPRQQQPMLGHDVQDLPRVEQPLATPRSDVQRMRVTERAGDAHVGDDP